ncbi:hypothetical protein VTN77DRAFT_8703 [Rasamsonia byssochlamydoides]|uniref:uncharacterized protein n=1 Tax=Rasamsonia byssochlamydoides TaxID=89139 RepID=UPI0037445EC5
MANAQESDQPEINAATQDNLENYHALEPESYTTQRLRHASAHHVHLTTRRFFIGPIPEGWIHNHRRSWYRTRLSFKNYTSRTITFSADPAAYARGQRRGTPHQSIHEEETGTDSAPIEDGDDGESRAPGTTEANETDSTNSENQMTPAAGERTNSPDKDDAEARSTGDTQISSSFATARETLQDGVASGALSSKHYTTRSYSRRRKDESPAARSFQQSEATQPLTPVESSAEAGSTTSLLAHQKRGQRENTNSSTSTRTLRREDPEPHDTLEESANAHSSAVDGVLTHLSNRLARFNLNDTVHDKQRRLLSRIQRTQDSISANRPRWSKNQEGEMVRAEKMLVRVEETMKKLPPDYSENESLKMETKVIAKWREYLVVCRKSSEEDTPYTLKMYKTRVIQDVEDSRVRKSACYEVPLNQNHTKVNLYSSLDKTVVIWHPFKRVTRIYIVRPRSASHAVEWYTFIRQILGWHRPSSLLINVPDLGISLIFKKPFEQSDLGAARPKGGRQEGGAREQLAAAAIISSCMKMLKDREEWAEVLREWSKTAKIGLAWKRYDRLEWVHGVNERQMYGTIAMQTSHDLELRPKHHYSTSVKYSEDDNNKEEEPAPVEGFLVRLTSQSGVQQRMGKAFFKRQYFFTQDRYLCFCKPAKAAPPHPPQANVTGSSIPSYREIIEDMPLQYDVNPFPVENGQITWLRSGNKEFIRRHDEEAYAQAQRVLHNLSHTEGFIDLCQIREVRVPSENRPRNSTLRGDRNTVSHLPVRDHHSDSRATNHVNYARTFELVLETGLVVRLQSYNTATRDEWVKRLEALIRYWKARVTADVAELKAVRQRNLELLDIDEETESILGQFACKWEVKRAEASPHLYNMCSISGCRAIKMSGQLYRKPRRHSTFKRCHVMLTAGGQLLIFQDTLRRWTGVEIPHIHKELVATMDLRDCYIYSGLLTESDLLYANQTFDSNRPGHHALPRIYLSQDGWTSRDEDTAICFVIWHPLRKSLFRAPEATGGRTGRMLRQVSTLGVPGRSVVFKARSRVEKDRWVLSIESEIDRLQEERGEDVRVVSS